MHGGLAGYCWFLIVLCDLVTPLASAQDVLERRGFRVPISRGSVKRALTKRHAGGGTATFGDGSFYTTALISGQELTFIVDTGSADTWVASTLLTPKVQAEITTGKVFNPNTSATYRTKPGYTFDIDFGDGSGAQGEVGIDQWSVGEAIVNDMPFGVTTEWTFSSGSSQGTSSTSGIMGLAFTSINTITPKPQCTFMECLLPSVSEPVFTISFNYHKTGFLDFGFVDQYAYSGDLSPVNIDNSTGFWGLNASISYGIGGKSLTTHDTGIFDTGTSFLYLPPAVVKEYISRVDGGYYDNDTFTYNHPCKTTLPDVELTFNNATETPVTAIISGDNLEYTPLPGNTSQCVIGMDDNTNIGFSIIGQPFFVDRYIVFNQSIPSVAFANATGNGTITPPPPSTIQATTPSGGKHKHTEPAKKSSSLSTGAQAGIGVGVAVVGLALIGLGIWAFRRRKKRSTETAAPGESAYEGKPELEGQGAQVQRSELRGESISEMPGPGKTAELQQDSLRHELPGDNPSKEMSAAHRHEAPA